jgi:hypothetical protein
MSNKAVVGLLLVVAVAAFLIGQQLAPKDGGKTVLNTPVNIQATITIDANNSCTQTVGGVVTAFPVLRAKQTAWGGDTITWSGVAANGNSAPLVVTFPQTLPRGGVGTPFTSLNGPDFSFNNGQNSGPASGTTLGDFDFSNVTVGGNACQNPTAGGVHVDR